MADRYELKNLKQAFDIVKDEKLERVHKQFVKDFGKFDFQGIYTSIGEISEGIRERILDAFHSKYNELKSDISHLRKGGFEVSVLDFNLLRIPLKEKMLLANFCLEAYEPIVKIFTEVEDKVKFLVEEMEKQEREYDEAERIKFVKERQDVDADK
jgi:hypothetical protein